MKRCRKSMALVVLVLSITLLLSTAFAGERISRYSYISQISAGLRINGSSASAVGAIIPSGNYSTDISVMLQQQQSDGSWTTIASWSNNNPTGACEAGGSTTIATGYSYRTYVIGHVYDGAWNLIDTGTAYKY